MTNTRRSSRSKATTDSAAHSDPETAAQNSGTIEADVDDSTVDSTHQAVETAKAKQDQMLEATDPDVAAAADTQDPTTEQLTEAVTTPINVDLQEEEPVTEAHHRHHHHHHHHVQEETEPTTSLSSETTEHMPSGKTQNSAIDIQDDDHVDGSGVQVPLSTSDELETTTTTTTNTDTTTTTPATTKHAKRAVDDDSNTVAEEQLDYIAGVYKSPFRHSHKAERAGKEER
ncbi:hypothetical protein BGX31_003534 [Mortierella sp. GBA43]|nr:hypothetical protein BGX31_003534 [Mortierella sp. GBA43]